MGWLGSSLDDLRTERDALQAELDARAMGLAGRSASTEHFVSQLAPLTTRLVELDRQILFKTPRDKLLARQHDLEQQLSSAGASSQAEQSLLQSELRRLNGHLKASRDEPLTLKVVVILALVVAAMTFLPPLIVDWLVP